MHQLFTNVSICSHRFFKLLLPTTALLVSGIAFSEIRIPPGATVQLAGGSVDLLCSDLQVSGSLALGTGGSAIGARNVQIDMGAQLDLSGSTLQLAQDFHNAGTVLATSGSITRVDSTACPSKGALGLVEPNGPTQPASTVAVPSLQTSSVVLLTLLLAAAAGIRQLRTRIKRSRY